MAKYITVKELSPKGHNTYRIDVNEITEFVHRKLDGLHVLYCEPMQKIISSVNDFREIIGLVKKVMIIPKIRGG
ncbi:MAG: hypothetical protein HWN67_02355 [Candidatus Helarchaeota archaeon]|nr:hypothetical protein [Candidatus Helarchaeota archaeon]